MVFEPKKKVWAVGNLEPMGNDPKAFPEADYLANDKRPRNFRMWRIVLAIVTLTIVGLLVIYSVAVRFDYLRHH